MAMDDIYRLVQAVLIDGRMFLPTRVTGLVPEGPWKEAEILDASVTGDHSNGMFNGYVRYVVKGEKNAQDATFHRLWLEGWTSREVRDAVELERAARRRKIPKLQTTLYVVQYADGREYINREPLSKADLGELKRRRERFREAKYRLVK